ncbi:apolipoprotein D-like [Homarus americanus]|nr:apolipoprotein D-like [Homarus americanus]XP_042230483.1 apolipoprotein D-like [Homarus americanus]
MTKTALSRPSLLHLLLPLLLLGQTAAQVLLTGRCPKIHPLKNFQPKRFLGRWYEIERFFVSYEGLAGTCWVENYLYDPHRGHYTRLDWKDRLSGKILSIENGITHNKHEPGRLRFVLQRPSIPFLQGEYIILATDYSTFALAWQCDNLPLGVSHTEILWLLSKRQHPSSDTIHHAKKLAHGLGLDINRLQKQDRSNCPP